MPPEVPSYIFDIFTAATALAVVMQACILLGMFLVLKKLEGKIETILDHSLPLIKSTTSTLEELAPKLKIITGNLVEVSETLKHESKTIKTSVDDILKRTHAQTARVDEMVSGTLDGLSHAAVAIQHSVDAPLRQINGILSGLRAGFSVLRKKPTEQPFESAVHFVEPVIEPEVIVVIEEIVTTKPGA